MKALFTNCIIFSVLICFPNIGKACGPFITNDETHFCLFSNAQNDYRGLEPFYYSENFLNSNIPDPQGLDYQKNCNEWFVYINNRSVSKDDIYELQYKTSADSFLNAYNQDNWRAFRKNTFVQYMLQSKNKNLLTYFVLAKKIEQTQDGLGNLWNQNIDIILTDSMYKYAKEALSFSQKTKDVFLKQRYVFQALKMAYYAGIKNKEAQPYFQQFEKVLIPKSSIVRAWGYLYYGMMQTDSIKKIEALLKSFDLSEEKKVFCYRQLWSYDKNTLLQTFKDKQLQEVILAIKAMSTFGKALETVQQLYQLNPESKYLPFLLGREINKLETWIWSYEYLGFDNSYLNDTQFSYRYVGDYNTNFQKDLHYLNDVNAFMKKALQDKKNDAVFITLASAHLYSMQKNFNAANELIKTIQTTPGSAYHRQYLIAQVILKSNLEDIRMPETKAFFVNVLQFLSKDKLGYDDENFWSQLEDESADDADELMLYLSKQYQAIDDIVTAGLLYQKTTININEYGKNVYQNNESEGYGSIVFFDKYASIEQVYQLISFKEKKEKTNFENFIAPQNWAKNDLYFDLIGTKYIRDEQYKKALEVFTRMSPDYWDSTYLYNEYLPQSSIFSLGHIAPWDTINHPFYTRTSKKEIVADLVEMESKLENPKASNDQKAALLYQLAKAKINMTYDGAFWMMVSYGKFYNEQSSEKGNFYTYSFYPNSQKYGKQYYEGYSAKLMLEQALKLTKNNNLKAQIYCTLRIILPENDVLTAQLFPEIKNNRIYEMAAIQCPNL